MRKKVHFSRYYVLEFVLDEVIKAHAVSRWVIAQNDFCLFKHFFVGALWLPNQVDLWKVVFMIETICKDTWKDAKQSCFIDITLWVLSIFLRSLFNDSFRGPIEEEEKLMLKFMKLLNRYCCSNLISLKSQHHSMSIEHSTMAWEINSLWGFVRLDHKMC